MSHRIAADDALFETISRREEHFYRIQDYTMALYGLEQRCSYPDFDASSRYCMDILRKSGFERIERIAHRADGQTAACDLIMPQAWALKKRSFLAITSDGVADYDRILADSDANPVAAIIWSAPTPPEGLDAEIVDYDALTGDAPDVKGKIVFFASDAIANALFAKIFHQMADAGAAGLAFSCFAAEKEDPEALYWYNGLGYYGWYLSKDDPKLPIFSLSPRRGRFLKELLRQRKVTVHAEMHTQLYDGEIYTVTGVIPGESEEEYALLAHMYEPFPGDDAQGVALAAEIGRVLKDSGVRPRKTLRAVFSMELYGFAAFLEAPERHDKILAALSMDGFTHRCSPLINFRRAPIVSPFFGDLFFRYNVGRLLPDAPVDETFGSFSDDTFASDPAFGIPTNWLYNRSGVWHHNTGIGFLPDWKLTGERFPALADTVLKLVCCDSFPDFAPESLRQYREDVGKILQRDDLTDGEKRFQIRAKCDFYIGRLRSVERFAPATVDERPFQAVMAEASAGLADKETLSEVDGELDKLIPERFAPGCPMSLARIPRPEKRLFSAVGLRGLFACFDGRRTLLEAFRLMETDAGRKSSPAQRRETLEYLRYLERYGYVRLKAVAEA